MTELNPGRQERGRERREEERERKGVNEPNGVTSGVNRRTEIRSENK